MSGFDFDQLDQTMTSTNSTTAQSSGQRYDDSENMKGIWLYNGESAEEYKDWKRWAEAHLLDLDEKRKPGVALFKLLRGTAKDAVEHIQIPDLEKPDAVKNIFEVLETSYP